jgi:hypothetical protein
MGREIEDREIYIIHIGYVLHVILFRCMTMAQEDGVASWTSTPNNCPGLFTVPASLLASTTYVCMHASPSRVNRGRQV